MLPLLVGACLAGSLLAQEPPSRDAAANTWQTDISIPKGSPVAKRPIGGQDAGTEYNIREYQAQVYQLETNYDAYHADLSEAVAGLALAYQQAGDHEDAIKSLQRALHINRVNNGLYHVSKIPLIDHLIFSYAAERDWEAVGNGYSALMQLYSRNYNDMDAELLPGLAKMIRWHWFAFGGSLNEQPINDLLLAREFLLHTIGIIKYNYGEDDLRQLDALSALVITEYFLTVSQYQSRDALLSAQVTGFREEYGDTYGQSLGPFQNMFAVGVEHIEEMIRIAQTNPATPPRTIVDTRLLLGDWNLLFKKKMSADDIYRQVWAQAQKLEDHESYVDEVFGQLVKLPDITIGGTSFFANSNRKTHSKTDSDDNDSGGNSGDPKPELNPKSSELSAIVFAFELTTSGRAVEARVVEADPGASKHLIGKARKRLTTTRFRPRYASSGVVKVEDAQIRYLFEADPQETLAEAGNEK